VEEEIEPTLLVATVEVNAGGSFPSPRSAAPVTTAAMTASPVHLEENKLFV
jgi:hypothetical protein